MREFRVKGNVREFEDIGKGLEKGLERVRVFRMEVERNQKRSTTEVQTEVYLAIGIRCRFLSGSVTSYTMKTYYNQMKTVRIE